MLKEAVFCRRASDAALLDICNQKISWEEHWVVKSLKDLLSDPWVTHCMAVWLAALQRYNVCNFYFALLRSAKITSEALEAYSGGSAFSEAAI